MGWDSSRPVPWQQLIRSWLLYAAVMAVAFFVLFRDDPISGIIIGLLLSFPLYLAVGYVLAKFGYQRKTLKQLRAESPSRSAATADPTAPRPKPAPTKRTGGGTPSRPGGRRRRR